MFIGLCGEPIVQKRWVQRVLTLSAGGGAGFRLCITPYRPCQSLGSLDPGLCPWTWPSCPQHWSGYNPWTSSSWPVCGETNHCKNTFNACGELKLNTIIAETTIKHQCSAAPYLCVELGQLLFIQIGLFIHSGLISKLKQGQKKRKGNERLITVRVENQRTKLQVYCTDNLYLTSHTYLFSLLETDKYERNGLVLKQFKELWRDHSMMTRGGGCQSYDTLEKYVILKSLQDDLNWI